MSSEEIKRDDFTEAMPQRAVSIYGQNDGMDDFPVLKAFQQYIDAEQEKARQRILWLGICFGGVLVIVIVVFMLLLYGINSRNQALSDRLVEYAMNEACRHQKPEQTPAAKDDMALKAITETLQSFQKTIENRQKRETYSANVERKAVEDADKFAHAKALLAAEKQRLAVEKERLHQIEIEQQRRRLYPELYESGETYRPKPESSSRSMTRNLTDEDIREIIREAYPEQEMARQHKSANKESECVEEKTKDTGTSDEAIEYFKDDDYTIPVDVKGSSSKIKFTVPVE